MLGLCYTLTVVGVLVNAQFETSVVYGNNISVGIQVTVTCPSPTCCQQPACVSTAAAIKEKMNSSADPCEDFNEFACGRFLETTVLPPGVLARNGFSDLNDKNMLLLDDIIFNNTDPVQPQYLRSMLQYFHSCMNQTQIEIVGLTPFLNDRKFVDDWPTLNPHWNDSGFVLSDVIVRYARVNVYPIFDVWVKQNATESTKHFIELNQPYLLMHWKYYTKPRNDPVILAYEKYLAETAIALNASRDVAERDAREVVDLEIEISKIMFPPTHRRDDTKQITRYKLKQFYKLYPRLDIARAIRETFITANVTIPDDELVVLNYPRYYMKDIEAVLECVSKRTIQNLFGFSYAISRVQRLNKKMINISDEFLEVYNGYKKVDIRLNRCKLIARSGFQLVLEKMFVSKLISQNAIDKVREMIDEINQEFRHMIEEATWMSNATKSEAFRKLAAMKRKVGYPDFDFEEADIERYYEKYNMSADNFYSNLIFVHEQNHLKYLAILKKPVHEKPWYLKLFEANGFAQREMNQIVILAGIMQPPFYSETTQDYMNYGALGFLIGHEISHLFDYTGSQYDENGTWRNWWTKEDEAKFANRSQCIVDQYSNFHIDDINMTTNGTKSRDENESDTVGIRASFRAYKKHFLRHGYGWLPNVNLTHDQLFFVSFAQLFCHVLTPNIKRLYVQHTAYAIGKYRIIGALQNSEDFARAYSCPLGSYMNPEKKCGVW